MRKIAFLLSCFLAFSAGGAHAQSAMVMSSGCGTAGYANVKGGTAETQDTAGNLCVSTGAGTIVALDVATVTTGGTAVTALTAGHRNRGGWLQNPKGATIDLCINEQGTASGTTSSGATTCVVPGQTYTLTPSTAAVSVITSDSSHPFSGQGYN